MQTMRSHCVLLLFVALLNAGVYCGRDEEQLAKKSAVEFQKKSPISHTLDSLLKGMELANLKRSVDNQVNKAVASTMTKDEKELPKWLKPMKPIDWLKEEVDKFNEGRNNKLYVSQFPDLIDLKKGPMKIPDWLKPSPTKQPDESSSNSDVNVDSAILNELSHNPAVEINSGEKKTVDNFIEALKEIADEETQKLSSIKRQANPFYARTMEETEQCKDVQPDCKSYSYFCSSFKQQMKANCAKTCNFCDTVPRSCEPDIADKKRCSIIKILNLCKQPTSQSLCATTCVCEDCANSEHGCCWDKKTMKDDEIGSNCPECKDKYHSSVCERFRKDCHSNSTGARQWMKRNCMKTCKYCDQNETNQVMTNQKTSEIEKAKVCKDADNQKDFCPIWKNSKWCEEKQDIMEKLCPKTCYDCNLTDAMQNS